MWIFKLQLFTIILLCLLHWCHGVEKDIQVDCLDGHATAITEGGVIANCAFQGITRTSTIGPWLFQLSNILQGINASHNHIKRVSVFPVLPRVLTLTLEHNSIREIEPLAFTGLENLQNLDLSYNSISGESLRGVLVGKKAPERYEPLLIRSLFLSHNLITSLDATVFEHLQYLRELHLDYNPVTVINEDFTVALRRLPELQLLNLAGTRLSSLPKDAFLGMQLRSLLLNGNKFTIVPDLSVLRDTLEVLNINQNPIEELDEGSFADLRTVNKIMVSGMPRLRTIKSGTFSHLENLKVVSCSYNPELVTIEENAFWNYKTTKRVTLQEVFLNNNAFPRIRKHLLPWVKLSKVTLDGNKWVCDCRLHWLATLLRSRNSTVDRLTEIKCWDPTWLNGTEMVFWNIDTKNRYENFPCLAEIEEERKEEERYRLELERLEQKRLKNTASPPAQSKDSEEGNSKFLHFIIVSTLIALVILIGSIIAFNKYRNYRPIYHVEKMSSPMHNEMKFMKGSTAERTQLVS